MRILAYTFSADVHCVACTREAYAAGALARDAGHPYAEPDDVDEHGMPGDLVDGEWNIIHPILSVDVEQEEHCGDCLAVIPGTGHAGDGDIR